MTYAEKLQREATMHTANSNLCAGLFSDTYGDADAKVREILQQRTLDAEVQRKLELVESYGPDDYTDDTVLRFNKHYDSTGKTYSYVAIKAGGKWYMTGCSGHSNRPLSWNEMLEFFITGVPVTIVRTMTYKSSSADLATKIDEIVKTKAVLDENDTARIKDAVWAALSRAS